MSKHIKVKYFQESEFAKEPCQASEGSAGYDLFAAEAMTILPRSCEKLSLDLRWAIPKRFHGNIYPCSSFVKEVITVDAGLIDSDYKGIFEVLFANHSEKAFTMRTGDRVAQVVFIEQYNVKFEKVDKKDLLGTTKRGDCGFDSTGMTLLKKAKNISTSDEENVDTGISAQIVEKPKDDLEITSKEGVMEVNNEVIIHQKTTID